MGFLVGMKMAESSSKARPDYRNRIWNKNRKPWEGETGGVEAVRRAIWRSLYRTRDRRHFGYTAAEIGAACLIVKLEALNHGAAERGFGNPYDQKRVETGAEKLYQKWLEMTSPEPTS